MTGCRKPRPAAVRGLALFCGLILIPALSGCAAARRDAREAQDETRVPAGERTVTAAEAGLVSNAVLTLPLAETLALQFRPSVVVARQNLEIARAEAVAAGAGAMPQIGASAGRSFRTENTGAEPESWDTSDSTRAGLSADLLLYDFGRNRALVRAAEARVEAAELDRLAVESEARLEVRTAYYAVWRDNGLVEVGRETVRQFEERLRQTRGLIEVGKRIPYDLTKAEVDLGNARIALLNASRDSHLSKAELNRAIGFAEDPAYALAEPPDPVLDPDLDRLMARALEAQPGLASLRAGVVAAFFLVDAEIANLYPAFRLGAGFNWAGASFPLIWNASAAIDAVASLWDGGTKNSRIAIAAARLRSARARFADQEQRTYANLSRSLAALDSARQRAELEELIARQAREGLILTAERYRLGLANAVELTDAQVALAVARAGQVRARFDVLSQWAVILNTVGES
jgi:outer membrane protein